jgi:hypothetical protein|tara:strand:- start:639 stop:809 length:171 start_codon:yes stop_codon:yes gene_type:complete
MTNKEILKLTLKLLQADLEQAESFNHPSISEEPCFSPALLELVNIEIKRLKNEVSA